MSINRPGLGPVAFPLIGPSGRGGGSSALSKVVAVFFQVGSSGEEPPQLLTASSNFSLALQLVRNNPVVRDRSCPSLSTQNLCCMFGRPLTSSPTHFRLLGGDFSFPLLLFSILNIDISPPAVPPSPLTAAIASASRPTAPRAIAFDVLPATPSPSPSQSPSPFVRAVDAPTCHPRLIPHPIAPYSELLT